MDEISSILEAISRLGAMGVLSAIIVYIFWTYLPRVNSQINKEREADRQLQIQQAAACHASSEKIMSHAFETIERLQTKYMEAIDKEREAFQQSIASMQMVIRENTEAQRNNTSVLVQGFASMSSHRGH